LTLLSSDLGGGLLSRRRPFCPGQKSMAAPLGTIWPLDKRSSAGQKSAGETHDAPRSRYTRRGRPCDVMLVTSISS
jgi:hypothetical protein